MIKPLEEYSPEDRAFVEYVESLRRIPPQPIGQDVGPINWDEVREEILADLPPEDDGEEPAFQFGRHGTPTLARRAGCLASPRTA
jgi:hypothetical protein